MIDKILGNLWICFFLLLLLAYFIWNFVVDNWIISDKTKHVLITGCDSGFGYATALDLNASNCKVYAGCLTEDGVKKIQDNEGFQGIAFIMDVTKEEDVKSARRFIEEETKETGLDAIVNNAGIVTHGLIEWHSIELMKKVFEVNYWGTVRVIKEMLPLLKKSQGRIINVTSMGGRVAPPYNAPYYSSKFAAEGFSDSLRFEVKPWGVSVHLIEPTFYKTELTSLENLKKAWGNAWNSQPQELKEEFTEESVNKFVLKFCKGLQSSLSKDISEVTGKIKHAVLSRFPRRRYIVGKDSFAFALVTHLPTVTLDWILSRRLSSLVPEAKKNK